MSKANNKYLDEVIDTITKSKHTLDELNNFLQSLTNHVNKIKENEMIDEIRTNVKKELKLKSNNIFTSIANILVENDQANYHISQRISFSVGKEKVYVTMCYNGDNEGEGSTTFFIGENNWSHKNAYYSGDIEFGNFEDPTKEELNNLKKLSDEFDMTPKKFFVALTKIATEIGHYNNVYLW